jgi:GT2 family glycosyltransferase
MTKSLSVKSKSRSPMLTISAIICTRNRPDDLRRAIASITAQTRHPKEIVVVDGSDDEIRARNRGLGTPNLVQVPYDPSNDVTRMYRAARLNAQHNLGVNCSSGDVVLFLDDDVVLDPHYIEALMEAFERDPSVVGASGTIINVSLAYRILFGAFAFLFWGRSYTAVRAGIGATPARIPRKTTPSCRLHGCDMAFKRELAQRLKFDEEMPCHGCEDIEFPFRASRFGKLVFVPGARLEHLTTRVCRPPASVRYDGDLSAWIYLTRKYFPDSGRNRLLMRLSALGMLCLYCYKLVITGGERPKWSFIARCLNPLK